MNREKLSTRVPNTGQKKSYLKFDDGYYYQKSPFCKTKRFVNNNDRTITDKVTGLKWIKSLTTVWYEAVLICKKLNFNKINSWRLPNINELMSIVDYFKEDPPINNIFDCITDGYWSSTTYVGSPSTAWVIYFDSSGVYFTGKSFRYSIRTVCDIGNN